MSSDWVPGNDLLYMHMEHLISITNIYSRHPLPRFPLYLSAEWAVLIGAACMDGHDILPPCQVTGNFQISKLSHKKIHFQFNKILKSITNFLNSMDLKFHCSFQVFISCCNEYTDRRKCINSRAPENKQFTQVLANKRPLNVMDNSSYNHSR